MEHKLFKLEIVTPSGIIYQDDIRHIKMPGTEGYLGIMFNHAPFITTLKIGEVKIDLEKKTKYFALCGGVVEVLPDMTTLLVESAEEASDIDVERAIYSEERAERRLKDKIPDIDIERARLSLSKAQNRIKVSKRIL